MLKTSVMANSLEALVDLADFLKATYWSTISCTVFFAERKLSSLSTHESKRLLVDAVEGIALEIVLLILVPATGLIAELLLLLAGISVQVTVCLERLLRLLEAGAGAANALLISLEGVEARDSLPPLLAPLSLVAELLPSLFFALGIYILAAKHSKATVALFKIQMNTLNGPLLAFIFPEVKKRILPHFGGNIT
uniref:Uncharacterized protein n=1 Tax=Glossina pallidipes TaxID=7398 RepID=A0A1B0A4M7_GLOPL